MPDLTPRLGIKKPLGNEVVTRESFNENFDIIDAAVARKSDVDTIRMDGTKPLILEVRTSDPVNPEIGRIWLRSDL